MDELIQRTAELRELPDGDKGELVISFGKTGVPDLYGDVFEPGSYKATRDGPVFMVDWNHARSAPVGIGTIAEQPDGEVLWTGKMLETAAAADTWKAIKAMGGPTQWSYAFRAVSYYEDPENNWSYLFKEVEVYEVCPVLKAATPSSHLVGMKAYADWRADRKAGQEQADDGGPAEERVVFAAFTYKKLITQKDDRVDPVCAAAAAKGAIPWDTPFTGDLQEPPLHPNCRCVVAYEYKFSRGDGESASVWVVKHRELAADEDDCQHDHGKDDLAKAYMTGLLAGNRG